MSHSSFVWQGEYEKLMASGHDGDGNPLPLSKFTSGNAAYTLYTTTSDYAKFVAAILKGIGLKRETIDQMLTPQIRVDESCVHCIHKPPGNLSNSISWGLGWGLQEHVEGKSFWHWGDNHGFKSYVFGFRKEKKAIIIFTNSSNNIGLSIIPEVIYKIAGTRLPSFDWIETEKNPF